MLQGRWSLRTPRQAPLLLPLLASALALLIFWVDTFSPLGIAIAVLYVVVIIIAANFLERRGILLVSALCLALTVLSYLTQHGLMEGPGLIRCLVSLAAIVIATALILQTKAADAVLHERASLLDLTHDAVLARDIDDVITYWNHGAEEMYGFSREEALGKVSYALMRTQFPEPQAEIKAKFLRTGIWQGELVRTRKDGTEVIVASRWLLRRDRGGHPIAMLETNNDITGRKRAEAKLQAQEQEARLVIDTMPALVWSAKPDGSADFNNQRWLEFTGLTAEEAQGWGYRAALHPDDFERLRPLWSERFAAGKPFEDEARLRGADGEYRWFLNRVVPLCNDEGKLVKWYGTSTDIEERKRAEERVLQAERDLQRAIDTIPTLVWSNMPDGPTDFLNKRWLDYTGMSLADARGFGWNAAYHPDDIERVMRMRTESMAKGAPYEHEARIKGIDGRYRWFLNRAAPLRDEAGRIVKWFGTNTDIEDRRRAEDALREQAQLLDLTHDTIFKRDMNDVITYWNRGAEELYGWTRQEALGSVSHQLMQTVLPAPIDKIMAELLLTGRWEGEAVHRKRDRTQVTVSSRWSLQRDARGEPAAILETNTDISERKQAEDALRRSEAYLAEAQHLSRTGSFGWDIEAGRILWSDESFRIFDLDRAVDPTIEFVLERTHPEDRSALTRLIERVTQQREDWETEHRLLLPDGSVRHIHVMAHASSNASGGLEYVGALMDVTETKRAQEALHRAQTELAHVTRITALGELTASIAHEVFQPLAAVITNGEACLRWLANVDPKLDEVRSAVERMIRDGNRASEVIQRLRALTKKTEPVSAPLDLSEVITEVTALVQRELTNNRVILELDLAPDGRVVGDKVQLQQVIINLVMNGIEAMASVDASRRELAIVTRADGPEQVLVQVRDSGTGIAPENMDRLFNAFFTTKPAGMGMGLSICRSIIEAHGGQLWASSNEPNGAIFQFTLPAEGETKA